MGAFGRIGKIGDSQLSTEARIQKALDTIKARGVENDFCPRCGIFDWNVDLLDIAANSEMASRFGMPLFMLAVSPPKQTLGSLSVLSITCKNCGYTMFHTLNVLEGLKPIERKP
jgi:predicted nucleic-acid-binding Zn-ribbon protein